MKSRLFVVSIKWVMWFMDFQNSISYPLNTSVICTFTNYIDRGVNNHLQKILFIPSIVPDIKRIRKKKTNHLLTTNVKERDNKNSKFLAPLITIPLLVFIFSFHFVLEMEGKCMEETGDLEGYT